MSAFSAINLAQLPVPHIIEQPGFEQLFESRKARLLELAAQTADVEYFNGLSAALQLESEPIVQLMQEDAYREMILRQDVQDAGRGNMLAYASGTALDNLGAIYGVQRQIVTPADPDAIPPVQAVFESDDRLRTRVQLAPEGYTNAGSRGAYTFWALSAAPNVRDISVLGPDDLGGPGPGEVLVTILASDGDGTPDQALLNAVTQTLNGEEIRPLCDTVIVQAPAITTYSVDATLTLYFGPGEAEVLAAAEAAVAAYADAHFRVGHDITRAGLIAALYQEGVQNVVLTSPAADIVNNQTSASNIAAAPIIAVGGRDV